MGNEVAVSQELLERRADALLAEWGDWQRREPGVLSVPRHPIAAAMEDMGRRTKPDQRDRAVWRRHRRLIEVRRLDDGRIKRTVELPMAPDRNDKQSKGGPRKAEPWPAHVMAVDRVIASMPPAVQAVLRVYYIEGHSIRTGADILRIDRNRFERQLDRGRWFLIGDMGSVDSALSRQ